MDLGVAREPRGVAPDKGAELLIFFIFKARRISFQAKYHVQSWSYKNKPQHAPERRVSRLCKQLRLNLHCSGRFT
jgi:hypothetical protein